MSPRGSSGLLATVKQTATAPWRLLSARALVHRPRLLMLDEPTAGADLALRHELWTYHER